MSSQKETQKKQIEVKEIFPYQPKPRKPFETFTPCGDKYIIKQNYTYDEDGNKIAKPGEKIDIVALIQSARESCDIAAIIAKYQAGDESVLNVHPESFFGDSTVLPKDLYDVKRMNDLYDSINESFDKLPDGLKELFKNDSNEFFNSILNNKANDIIEGYNAKVKEDIASSNSQQNEGESK